MDSGVSATVRIAHHRPAALVDLRFLARGRDDNSTGRLRRLAAQPADEAFDAGVAPRETIAVDQVLVDPLGVAALAQRQFDEVEVGLAGAARGTASGEWRRLRVGGHRWPVLDGSGRESGDGVGGQLDCFTAVTQAMLLAPKADGAARFPSSPVLSFKHAHFLDFLLKILPPEILPHEEESYNPYGENQEERKSIQQ